MNKVSILSVNAQGLGDKNKRKDVFNFLKEKKASIYFIQDTHFTDSEVKHIYIEFGYTSYFSNNSSNSRGVAIFIDNKLDFKMNSIFTDKEGNLIILDCLINNKNITLVNLYGPNKDSPQFYNLIKDKIQEMNNPCIIAGDFNLVLNPSIDYHDYLHINNPKARDSVLELIIDNNLVGETLI